MVLKKHPKKIKISSIITDAILIVLVMISLVIGFSFLPVKNNYKFLAVTSGSMEPFIKTGNLAIIKPAGNYKIGDIITFKTPNAISTKETTTHRISSISEQDGIQIYSTKGDANNSLDSQIVTKSQIVGKYQFSIRFLGYLLQYLRTLPGLILLVIIPATIIIYEEVQKIVREIKDFKKRKINNGAKNRISKNQF